ncbi:MAG TPA: hypothetical protein VKH19_13790 [Gemmatimonadaceae bacterium]|nr:hypothetical protein [Gemmatimonadaceae bacterium]
MSVARRTLHAVAVTATLAGALSCAESAATETTTGPATLLFEERFEDAGLPSRGWYDNNTWLLSTAEHVGGSTSSSQYRFLPGAITATIGGTQRHKFGATPSVYVSYWVKYSTNWVGSGHPYQPHEFYVLTNLDSDYEGPSQTWMTAYVEQVYQNGGQPIVAIQDNKAINTSSGSLPNNLVGVTENRSTSGCNGVVEQNVLSECFINGSTWYNRKLLMGPVVFQPAAGAGYKSNWNHVEAYFQLNTITNGVAQADGVMQYWFNGAVVLDRHDILFRTAARTTMLFDQLIIGPYIGDGSPVDQSFWIDNLRVATGRLP